MEWVRKYISYVLLSLGAGALLVVGALTIYSGLGSQQTHEIQTAKATQEAYDRAYVQVQRECAPLPPPRQVECVQQIQNSYESDRRQIDDLHTQRITANWTGLMGVAAIAGTTFGIIGVTLVLLTFMEQRQTSRAELRAYVFPESVTLFDGTDEVLRWDFAKVPNVHILVKNFGSTPARKVKHGCALVLIPTTESPTVFPNLAGTSGSTLPPGATQLSTTPLSGAAFEHDHRICLAPAAIAGIKAGTLVLVAYGVIEYKDVFGGQRKTEYRFFHTNHWPPDGGNCGMRFVGEGNRDE